MAASLDQLTFVMNETSLWTHMCVSLHGRAVRSPAGGIALFPAVSGGGKSTLSDTFVAAGWDYLGDETIGIRPETCTADGYPKRLAIDALLANTLNLGSACLHALDSHLLQGMTRGNAKSPFKSPC